MFNEARRRRNIKTTEQVERKAHWLAVKFQSPDSYEFFCKVSYALEDQRIDDLVAKTVDRKADNPGAYFNKLASREMNKKPNKRVKL